MTRSSVAPARSALCIDVIVDSRLWASEPKAKAVARRAIEAAAGKVSGRGELAVLLTDDSAIRALNRFWRGKDNATNVLSFPAPPAAKDEDGAHLGNIVVAYETTAREANEEGKPLAHHLAHLVVHGYLHLVGYDHATEAEAETMECLEAEILSLLKIADPYALRDARTST